jgi:putative endonuclease
VCPESSREKGTIGEKIAVSYLRHEGLTILERNYRACSGEVDIIARDGAIVVFVEVKSSLRGGFGDPLGWIPPWKQQRIIKTSLAYLNAQGKSQLPMRFDVITVDRDRKVVHVRDAFRPTGPFPV